MGRSELPRDAPWPDPGASGRSSRLFPGLSVALKSARSDLPASLGHPSFPDPPASHYQIDDSAEEGIGPHRQMKVLDLRRREFVKKHHHQARFVGYERFAVNLTRSDSMNGRGWAA
jgi:hypothetical protein